MRRDAPNRHESNGLSRPMGMRGPAEGCIGYTNAIARTHQYVPRHMPHATCKEGDPRRRDSETHRFTRLLRTHNTANISYRRLLRSRHHLRWRKNALHHITLTYLSFCILFMFR